MFFDNVLMALTELKANKMRSFLTMLGIVIGIASVIAIMTVGDSMNNAMMESMNDMGANNIEVYIMPKSFMEEDDTISYEYREMKSSDMITEEMFDDLQRNFSDRIEGILLDCMFGTGKVENGRNEENINITGVNAVTLSTKNLKLVEGRFFTKKEYNSASKVIIVDENFADKIFGSAKKAVGKSIECSTDNKYYAYTIVGVYAHQDSAGMFSMMDSGLVTESYIPLRTSYLQLQQDMNFEFFSFIAKPGENSEELSNSVSNFLNQKYYSNNDTYMVYSYSMQSMIEEEMQMLDTIKIAVSAIAAISLLVGGIGVMNIMVVSITERTREIGTRKALGATNASIRLQFITESIVMCVIGGIIGVIVGIGLGLLGTKLIEVPGTPSITGVIGSVLFSAAFGIFFGYYPANKAAKLNPIDALRFE